MRDHRKILGTLLAAWGGFQAVAAVVAVVWGDVAPTAMFWITVLLVAAVYAWVGLELRRGAQLRLAAGILSALALLSFPIGTALGIYGLWVVIRAPGWEPRRPSEQSEDEGPQEEPRGEESLRRPPLERLPNEPEHERPV